MALKVSALRAISFVEQVTRWRCK